ncbi:MAG: hypothetical protein RR510_05950 [Morganella sp. (in: enterobacteria)]
MAKGLKTEDDLNQISMMLTVETALNAELTDHLRHEKNASKSVSNTRNGYSSKTLPADMKKGHAMRSLVIDNVCDLTGKLYLKGWVFV